MSGIQNLLLGGGGATVPNTTPSYATWNPSDKDAAVALTGSNLTATVSTPNGENHLIRGTVGKLSGKWYWEVTAVSGSMCIGVGNTSVSLSPATTIGVTANGIAYNSNGQIYQNAIVRASVATYSAGAVVGIAYDSDARSIAFYKDGVLIYSGSGYVPTGTLYAMFGNNQGVAGSCTANFGATPFAYTPPGGYYKGLGDNLEIQPDYATLNPSDKGTGLVLSNGNLTMTTTVSGSNNSSVRATMGKSSGKWYWEATIVSQNAANRYGTIAAIGTAAASLATYPGGQAASWKYDQTDGFFYNNGLASASANATYNTGDVVGMALDMDTGVLSVYKNGILQPYTVSGLSGTIYPVAGAYSLYAVNALMNFGATAFAYAPPAGYYGGLGSNLPVQPANSYVATPTATPAAFGDAFEGGFYSGLIWNELVQSASNKAIATGCLKLTVADMTSAPLVYAGQALEVRSRANPANKMIGTVSAAYGTTLMIDVSSVGGSGTFSDWSVMSRYRVIVAPKASGENASIAYKNAATASPAACGTLTEGYKATVAMCAAGTATVYPAAWFCKNLSLSGKTDWHLPARDELELAYRNLKPIAEANYTPNNGNRPESATPNYMNLGSYGDTAITHGVNNNSSPTGATYTAGTPPQVAAGKNFRTGESEAFSWGTSVYWSSSEHTISTAWYQYWYSGFAGYQGAIAKTDAYYVRAVRRSMI